MAWIFLDESGQFTKHNGDNYFVVGSFTVGEPKRTEKGFKSWQRAKFPRKMRSQSEIKFSDVKITDKLRLNTLSNISKLDVRINYSFLLRENIPVEYKKQGKISESGLLYTNIVCETLEMYLPCRDVEFRIFCDKRHLKGIRVSDFRKMLISRLKPQLPSSTIIQVEMIDSTTNANIQVADWIASAIGRYHNNGEIGENCFSELKNNIVGSKELFKDYWAKQQKTRT